MQTLKPLLRDSIYFDGFNRILESVLEDNTAGSKKSGYIPYNIEKHSDTNYKIIMSVPGFDLEDLNITTQNNLLLITGKTKEGKNNEVEYLHKDISNFEFTQKFNLSDYIKVKGANLYNGLLEIDLIYEIPQALEPQKIQISSNDSSSEAKKIESSNKQKKPRLVS